LTSLTVVDLAAWPWLLLRPPLLWLTKTDCLRSVDGLGELSQSTALHTGVFIIRQLSAIHHQTLPLVSCDGCDHRNSAINYLIITAAA